MKNEKQAMKNAKWVVGRCVPHAFGGRLPFAVHPMMRAKKGHTAEGSAVWPGGGGNEDCSKAGRSGLPMSPAFMCHASDVSVVGTPDSTPPADRLRAVSAVGTNRAQIWEETFRFPRALRCRRVRDAYCEGGANYRSGNSFSWRPRFRPRHAGSAGDATMIIDGCGCSVACRVCSQSH